MTISLPISARANAAALPARWLVLCVAVLALLLSPGAAWTQTRVPAPPLWLGIGTALATSFALDLTAREEMASVALDRGRTEKRLARPGNAMGRPQLSLPLLAGTYGMAHLADQGPVADAALHTGVALGTAGVANGLLKFAVGRLRPRGEGGMHRFRPMNPADHWQSFPSGHTVVAFALASAIAEEANSPLVSVAGYSAAALVGWSRLYEDRHWASDVVGGAIVGLIVSRASVRWLHDRSAAAEHDRGASVWVSGSGIGVSIPTR